jgi:hypothetical protein
MVHTNNEMNTAATTPNPIRIRFRRGTHACVLSLETKTLIFIVPSVEALASHSVWNCGVAAEPIALWVQGKGSVVRIRLWTILIGSDWNASLFVATLEWVLHRDLVAGWTRHLALWALAFFHSVSFRKTPWELTRQGQVKMRAGIVKSQKFYLNVQSSRPGRRSPVNEFQVSRVS